ncbi:hypothetical protein COCC4DRAFT_65104 [Bipolaris maydis ATCC 48331]|uniref:Rhodopsin domain-containing protein n=1 Tax=Cochliobolus heterostrophus (strain C4 / ATCC 48331 / race T) TaxID=665024 RepID=N4WXN6_COCH4|nr:uncharacterized protein COCC4DRAFT_65104 [Bipolaris maydis ATCC 48331]ENI00973.1 hypothetical protein COCC4DRAFT_65104 [Bipolaris maydis ATCC 48331]
MAEYSSWVSNPDESHGPLMSVVTWSLVSVAAAFLIPRLCIRQRQGKLWLDDCTLVVSWILLLVQVSINQASINLGYGRHTFDLDLRNLDKLMYIGGAELTIYTIAIALSKISFGLTLLRLTDGWVRLYVYFAISTLAIFAVPATIIPWVQCKPLAKTFVDFIPGECINKHPSVVYGRFQAVWSALMDVSLAILPWKILSNLQMRTAEKIGVCVAMSLGILAGVTSIIRSTYIEKLTVQDVSYESYKSIIWAVAECSMAIVATSIPVLRVVFKHALNSAIEGYTSSSRSKSRSKSRSYPSYAVSLKNQMSTRQSSKKTPEITVSGECGESLEEVFRHGSNGSQNYLELGDLAVDEQTGRITASFPESVSDHAERHVPNYSV